MSNLKTLFMAEIHVQAKKKTPQLWVWIVAAVLILGLIAFMLLRNKKTAQTNAPIQPPATFVQPLKTSQVLPYAQV